MSDWKLSELDLENCCSHIEKTLNVYQAGYEQNDGAELAIGDLLADLMHFCNANVIDFGACLVRAREHFIEESK